MKLSVRRGFALLAAALAIGCGNSSSISDNTAVGEAEPDSTRIESAECALLDNPDVRSQMSGAFELKLLRSCGRALPRRAPVPQATPEPTSDVAQAWFALTEQLGGNDILVNNPGADTGGHSTQSETSTVAAGQVVCASWNDAGEGYGSNGFSGFGYSLDGGQTFTDGGPFPNGTSDTNEGDPSLAYSAKDATFYYAALSTKGLSLWKSSSNCQSFQYVGAIHTGSQDDKELMAVDNTPTSPFYGRMYVGWTNFAASPNYNMVTYSDDGGVTWSSPATLPASGTNGQGMWPAVAPNGDVYFALLNRASAVGGMQSQWIYKSTDGGVTWIKATDIGINQVRPENAAATSSCGRQALTGNIRNLPSPQIAITTDANAPAGYVIHSVYSYDSDGSGADQSNAFYRRSVDGAATWSAEVKLNDDSTTTDQFFVALGVSETGMLVASWYDRRLDPTGNTLFDRYASYSVDRGLTWSPNERISDVSSGVAQTNPNFDGLATCYHGDYDQIAVSGSVAHVVWSDDRRTTTTGPNPDIYYDRVVIGSAVSVVPTSFEGGNAATGTLTLDSPAPASGTTVALVSSVPGLVSVPASVVVPAGGTSTTFAVASNSTSTQTPVTITATFPDAKTSSTTLLVLASPTPVTLVLSPTSITGGQPVTATVTLSRPAPAGGSVVALSSSPVTVATVPANLSVAAGAQSATFTVATLAQTVDGTATISASLNGLVRTAPLNVLAQAGNAIYDTNLRAARCTGSMSYCDTGASLVRGRASLASGVEPNTPNTLGGTCVDGTSGTFHYDESLDRVKISTVDGTAFAAGKQVNVEATVWVYSASDYLDVFFAPDAANPVWTLMATVAGTGSQQLKVIPATFILPAATLPAIRVQWRYTGTAVACASGSYNDRDDLVFEYQAVVDTTPPNVAITSPTPNSILRAVVPVNTEATDNVGVTSVVLAVDTNKIVPTKGTAPYVLPLNSATLTDGAHQLTAIASDAAGNSAMSPAVPVVVDNTPPTADVASPTGGSVLSGIATVVATATDLTSGVASVEFLADAAVFATDALAPYSADWNTASATPGTHTLAVRSTDWAGNQTVSAVVVVNVEGNNQAPLVNAGTDRGVVIPAAVALNGTVTDDGLPAPAALAIAWSMTSGPGTVTFANPAVASTTATFSAVGVYVLRLTASDGALSTYDEVQVTVSQANQAPAVTAGADLGVVLGAAATLAGTVTDDGLPAPAALAIAWSMTSGPGTVTFANPAVASTTATFSAVGVYVLRLTASDGALSIYDEVQVTVSQANQAPAVAAGVDLGVVLGAAATLAGTVTDDGLPAPTALTTAWSVTSGPGTVTFANPAVASTTATFAAAGVYVLRLTASDGALSTFDEVQVTVTSVASTPCSGLCATPTVIAINGSFQSGSLGTVAVCYETTSVIHGGNCGNFASPRILSVNGTTMACAGGNWASVPATRNGGYCIQATAGNYAWGYFTAW